MRHVVRKIEPTRATLFEDRLWPVLSAQLLLGGAVLGMIRLALRPDDPRPWLNPQVWTLVAVVAIAVGILSALCIKPHWMRRGAQLSLVLSLAINVTLLLVLSLLEITHAAVKPPEVAEIQPAPPVKPVEPEYFPLAAAGPDRPVEEWKKPVPTGDPQMQQQDWLNKSSQPWDAARPQVPEASAQASDPRSPLPRVQRQRMESAPREFDLQGALSRQDRADTPRVAPPLMDASAVAQQTQPARLAAPPAELQRQVTSVAEQQIDLESSPASQTPRLAEAQPQHQQAVAPEPVFDAQSALRRQMPTPGTPPQAEVAIADRPAAARLTDPAAAVQRAVSPQRSLAAPLPATLEASPGLDTTRVPDAPSRVRRQPSAIAAQMAESNEPLLARRETIEATPATVTRLAPLPAAVRSVAATDATAAAASVAMQRAEPVAPTPPLPSPSVAASLQPAELRRPTADAAPSAPSAGEPAPEALPDSLPRATSLSPAPPAAALARVGTDSGEAAGADAAVSSADGPAANELGPTGLQAAAAEAQRASTAELLAAAARENATGTNVSGPSAVPRPGQPQLERSGPLETPPAPLSQPGGGTLGRLQPASSALRLPAPTVAEALEVPGQETSSGQLEASPWADQGTRRSVFGTGIPGLQPRENLGASADQLLADGNGATRTSAAAGPPRARVTDDPQLALGQQSESGGSAPLDRATRRPAGLAAPVSVPVPVAGTLATMTSDPLTPDVSVAPQTGSAARIAAGALEINLQAPAGLGGLAQTPSPDVGVIQRRSLPESEFVADRGVRFLRRDPGGPPSLDTRVAIPADAFLSRFNRRGQEPAGGEGRASPQTEETIERGLVYLTRQQAADGHWSLAGTDDDAGQPGTGTLIRSDTAATGLALLSYLGAGYHHLGDKYRDEVRSALQFLVDHQQPDGDLYLPQDEVSNQSAWLYSHGIATIALCEAYGMTQDPQLRQPAQKAVEFIVAAQHPARGGWRYAPAAGSDTSVSGWMVMALRSAELAGLEVPATAWEGVGRWLDNAQASTSRPELYRYNPQAPETPAQAHGRRPSDTMTAVGLLMRMYTGWRRENPSMIRGAEYLRQRLPDIGSANAPRRDTYYWYYATQVMFHMRGEYWDDWNQRLHPLLVSSQVLKGPLAGSWDPLTPVADRWGAQGGRLYVTTLNLLSLEVYYRHLPIYEDTAR